MNNLSSEKKNIWEQDTLEPLVATESKCLDYPSTKTYNEKKVILHKNRYEITVVTPDLKNPKQCSETICCTGAQQPEKQRALNISSSTIIDETTSEIAEGKCDVPETCSILTDRISDRGTAGKTKEPQDKSVSWLKTMQIAIFTLRIFFFAINFIIWFWAYQGYIDSIQFFMIYTVVIVLFLLLVLFEKYIFISSLNWVSKFTLLSFAAFIVGFVSAIMFSLITAMLSELLAYIIA